MIERKEHSQIDLEPEHCVFVFFPFQLVCQPIHS